MAIEVATPPQTLDTFPTEAEAESYRDFRELEDEVAYVVLKCSDTYYVVPAGTKEDPRV